MWTQKPPTLAKWRLKPWGTFAIACPQRSELKRSVYAKACTSCAPSSRPAPSGRPVAEPRSPAVSPQACRRLARRRLPWSHSARGSGQPSLWLCRHLEASWTACPARTRSLQVQTASCQSGRRTYSQTPATGSGCEGSQSRSATAPARTKTCERNCLSVAAIGQPMLRLLPF